jgi:hypothetical protein
MALCGPNVRVERGVRSHLAYRDTQMHGQDSGQPSVNVVVDIQLAGYGYQCYPNDAKFLSLTRR